MKKAIFFLIFIIFIFIINNFVHSIYHLWQKKDLIVQAQEERERVLAEQKKLKQQLGRVQNPSFVEEEARNKLFLVKPDEQVVILPPPPSEKKGEEKVVVQKPNWEQWLQLFF